MKDLTKNDEPALWALDRAAQQCGRRSFYFIKQNCGPIIVDAIKLAARYIERYEEPPVDSVLKLTIDVISTWNAHSNKSFIGQLPHLDSLNASKRPDIIAAAELIRAYIE